jgi:hypothetical protein
MTDQRDRIGEEVEAAFVEADDAFWDDPTIIFGSESDKKRHLFEHLKRLSKDWDRPGTCMYRGCTARSIRRSHAIHRAGSIERIAEDQHVLTPMLNSQGEMSMGRIGINIASTFSGFCAEHEQLFAEFETAGSISSERHVVLQAYRTLCREAARKDHEIRGLERMLDQYRKARQNHYAKSIQQKLPGATFQSLQIKGDAIENALTTMLNGAKEDLAELWGDLHDQLFSHISGQPQEPSLQALLIPIAMPVSLSGLGVLSYKRDRDKNERTCRALCLLGILPQKGSTVAFIGADRKHADVVEAYRSSMMHGFNGLNAMESWMINGSDHWFIRPSSWAAIPQHRQKKVLQLLMSDDENIGAMLNFSILDEARRAIVAMIEDHIAQAVDRVEVLEMVSRETAKMT